MAYPTIAEGKSRKCHSNRQLEQPAALYTTVRPPEALERILCNRDRKVYRCKQRICKQSCKQQLCTQLLPETKGSQANHWHRMTTGQHLDSGIHQQYSQAASMEESINKPGRPSDADASDTSDEGKLAIVSPFQHEAVEPAIMRVRDRNCTATSKEQWPAELCSTLDECPLVWEHCTPGLSNSSHSGGMEVGCASHPLPLIDKDMHDAARSPEALE